MKTWRVTLYKDYDIICVENTVAPNRYAARDNIGWGKNYTHSNVEEVVEGNCTHCGQPIQTLAMGMRVCGDCMSAD